MNTYQHLKQCLKESRVADAIYMIKQNDNTNHAEYYLWNKIGGPMLVFKINLESNIIFETHWIDTCRASNRFIVKDYAKFIELVENNGKDSNQ